MGARHKTTLAVEALMEGEAEAITRKAIELAKDGDLMAIKIVLDRIAPARKGRAVDIELPPIDSVNDVLMAMSAIAAAVSAGTLSSDEARDLATLIEAIRRGHETVALQTELITIKEIIKGKKHEPGRN